ncbi:hypothetical protein D8674_014078 [Pyrus ussuriensis x Pyrus communis]|uniref:Uncharacterized protein n=1 Tax=Pyrus ussuriensis x Pyrus communis TaxID=2448454 RepID=A0A5N5GRJ3_9ROSA|nr:hypothetical protein D8674_014078 [Pyrus ussuriensis x Pyrus communis]
MLDRGGMEAKVRIRLMKNMEVNGIREWRTEFGAKDGEIKDKSSVGRKIGEGRGKHKLKQKGREGAGSYHRS